jgi:hypothetical protein
MNNLFAFALIAAGFYQLLERHDVVAWTACMGWAAALHDRGEIAELRTELRALRSGLSSRRLL